jgi:hypothetical protein
MEGHAGAAPALTILKEDGGKGIAPNAENNLALVIKENEKKQAPVSPVKPPVSKKPKKIDIAEAKASSGLEHRPLQ